MSAFTLEVGKLTKRLANRDGSCFSLEPVTLSVRAGEVLLIMGPNGCGKSTLLECISKEINPDSGTVQIHDGFVYMSQDYRRLTLPWATVSEHLRLLTVPANAKNASPAARFLTPSLANRLDLPAYRLSGGQLQALCLAQCLGTQHRLLLLDEPFSNLDKESALLMCRHLLEEVRDKGRSALVCAHAPPGELLAGATIREMERGRLI